MQLSEVETIVQNLWHFHSKYFTLSSCHMTDYISNSLWEIALSTEVKEELKYLSPDQLNEQIKNQTVDKTKPCIQEFFVDTHSSCLKNGIVSSGTLFSVEVNDGELESTANTFMTYKKFHEVTILSKVCRKLCEENGIGEVMDIGGGRGYLGTELAFADGLKVLAIDSSDVSIKSGLLRSQKLNKYWNGLRKSTARNEEREQCFRAVTCFVTGISSLKDLWYEGYKAEISDNILVTGLHCCGQLSVEVLKLFISQSQPRVLCCIGCCYHLTDSDSFPISNTLKTHDFHLDRNSRLLACQAPQRDATRNQEWLKSLFFRAILQAFLDQKYGRRKDWNLGKIFQPGISFHEYMFAAMDKLTLSFNRKELSETCDNLLDQHLSKFDQMAMFVLLRNLLGPVIESLILLDRYLFLLEQENVKRVQLSPLFDSVVSPRCFAVLAWK